MVQLAERAAGEHARRLLEGADEAQVVADLRDALRGVGERDEALAVAHVEHERLLAEDVQPARERLLHHRGVQARGRRDHHRVERLFREHALQVGMALEAGKLAERIGEVRRGVARGHDLDLGMRLEDGEMGQPHLAQSCESDPNHCGSMGLNMPFSTD